MTIKESKLTAFVHLGSSWVPCGLLSLAEEQGVLHASSFSYGLNYLKRTDALEIDPVSLGVTDRAAVSGKRLLPANQLTFFGGVRDAAPDAWGRRVIEARLKVPANSLPESRYLLHAGSERVGALDFRCTIQDGPSAGTSDWHNLAHLMEAADRIEHGIPIPAHLESIFIDGSALGGARPKATVRDQQGVLWLAKFASQQDRFDIPMIEYAALKLAGEAGLNVPSVCTTELGNRRIMLIRRFDRYWALPGDMPEEKGSLQSAYAGDGRLERRLGFVSGLTMMACDETESREKSYAGLAAAIRRHCHPSVIRADNTELFKRMIYNIFISNDDDHLRNHGFIWDPRLPGWRLSPLYDVLPRPSSATERFLHLGVGPQGRLATLDNALNAHEHFTLSKATACTLIGAVWCVVREWKVYFDEAGVAVKDIEKIAPAFRHIDAISTPALRKLVE